MKKQAFSSEKYLNLQRDHIIERINQFDGKLYLEFGGKMLEDFHAARVLPGYEPDNKIKLLQELRDQVEIVIAINANNIEHSKARGDLGISYDQEVLRLIDKLQQMPFANNWTRAGSPLISTIRSRAIRLIWTTSSLLKGWGKTTTSKLVAIWSL